MTTITLPSGMSVDFQDLPQEEIEKALSEMQRGQPELFEEQELSVTEKRRRKYAGRSIEEVVEGAKQKTIQKTPRVAPDHEGEVQDFSFQAFYGKADNDRGREMRLEQEFGPGTYQRVGPGDYFLLLDKVSDDKKEEHGLPDEGTIRVNKHGFSLYDIAAFGGKYKGPLIATLAAGLISTRLPLLGAMAVMGTAGAGGRAFDEFITETREGLQDQTDDEIWGDVATEGILFAAFEGGTRVLFKGLRRLIKGPGVSNSEDVARMEAQGTPHRTAVEISKEQSRVKTGEQIVGGARPTIYEATGKPIMGRLQAIWEGIFPNKAAAFQNREYVTKLFDKFGRGELSEASLKNAINANSRDISRAVQRAMVDPDAAVRQANKHLHKVIENQIGVLTERFASGSRQARDFESLLAQAARLFKQDSSILYNQADTALNAFGPGAARFSAAPLKDALLRIIDGDEVLRAAGESISNKPIFKYMLNPDKTSYTAGELNSLRQVLRMQANDPALVGSISGRQVGQLVDSIDNMINLKADQLAKISRWGQPGAGSNAWIVSPDGVVVDPTKLALMRQGVEQLKAANKHYSEGMEIFNSGAAKMINQNVKDGYWVDLKSVSDFIVKGGQPETLRQWLKAVTPSAANVGAIRSVGGGEWTTLARAVRQGDKGIVKEVNTFLKGKKISEKAVGRLSPWLDDMPKGDAYRQRLLNEYAEMLDQFAVDSIAKATPSRQRFLMRDMLAQDWLLHSLRTSRTSGKLNPGAFADKFGQLDNQVQNLLFGPKTAGKMRGAFKDYYLVGQNARGFRTQLLDDIANPTIRNKVESLQNVLRLSEEQSTNAVFRAVKNGTIDDADSLIHALIKNPRMIDDLKAIPRAEAQFNRPGGVRDMAMQRLMLEAFPDGVSSEFVASGAFGQNLNRTITKMNANGALAKMLATPKQSGQQVVDDLLQLSKDAMAISNLPLKGKGGLAAPAFVAGMTLMHFVTAPIQLLAPAVGIFTMGRVARAPWFLNWMVKPRFRARELEKGIRIVADDLMKQNPQLSRSQATSQARASLGNRNPAIEALQEAIRADIRAVTAIGTGEVFEKVEEEVITPIREGVQQNALAGGEGDDRLGAAQVRSGLGIPMTQAAPQQALAQVAQAQAQETPQQRAARVMAEIEQAKLTGAPMIT